MSESNSSKTLLHPFFSILLTLFLVMIGFQVIGPFLGALVGYLAYDGSATEYSAAIANIGKDPKLKIPLIIMQGVAAIFGLMLVPYYLLKKQKRNLTEFFQEESWHIQPALLIVVLVIVFMGVNSLLISWNQSIELPDWFGFNSWARNMEDRLQELTAFFTHFDSTGELFLALLVMALIPAIGEEFVFRGLIQHDLLRATRNPHVAIWFAAILFSAIHMQFFGFFPRVLLGALFGYLYYWSGNLIMPIIGHFVNNGVTVIGIYLYQQKVSTLNLDEPENLPLKFVIISAILSALLLNAYRTFYLKHARTETTNN